MQLSFAGLTTLDLAYSLPGRLEPGRKAEAATSRIDVGGPAANAARTAALLGSRVRLHTLIGGGPLADLARTLLAGDGVAVVDQVPRDSDWRLPVSTAIVSEGGVRTVVSANGLDAPVPGPSGVGPGTFLLIDGHHPGLALELASRRHECTVVLDGGSWKPGLERLLPMVDIAVVSADFHIPPQFRALADAIPIVARTVGADPISIRSASGETDRIDPEPVSPVDTLGAGDVLHGAFIHFLAEDRETGAAAPSPDFDAVRAALDRAAAVATRSCVYPGVTGWAR